MSKKVYCSECRNLHTDDWGSFCTIWDSTSGNYFTPTRDHLECSVANKNNNCEHYGHKRGFIEWINDLLQ